MKVAFVPWDDSVMEDRMFTPGYFGYKDSHIVFAEEMKKLGYEVHTIDMYKNLKEADLFLFSKMNYRWLNKVMREHLLNRAAYCSAEPPVVISWNCAEGYEKLLHIFANILTWNDDLVDNTRIFKRNIPYMFQNKVGGAPFKERRLMTNISGNKSSVHPLELYSEREKVITWFEQNQPDQFDLYGFGWNKEKHFSYKGTIHDKTEIYHQYRFALCLENMYNVRGYITEKICDCLSAGIVPVYKGAADILQFVPQECFINYDQFRSIDEMYEYLEGMTEEEYNHYLSAIREFLMQHDNTPFSETRLAEYVDIMYRNGNRKGPEITIRYRMMIMENAFKEYYAERALRLRSALGTIKRRIMVGKK